jgi:hypothetical protein
MNFIWNREELPSRWKGSITVPIHKKGDKTDCSNYCWISLLSISYKILSNVILSSLSPFTDETIGDHQCAIRRDRVTPHQIFIDFKKAHDLVRREVLYNILIEFGVLMKSIQLVKTCLKET